MNGFGAALVWGGLQATMFALVGAVVYVIVRRRGPATGSLTALSALVLLVGISLLAFSPWPHWWSVPASLTEMQETVLVQPVAETSPSSEAAARLGTTPANVSLTITPPTGDPAKDRAALVRAAWGGFVQGLRDAPAPDTAPGWRWPAVVAALLLVGVAMGFSRLVLGWLAVARYRRRSRRIDDSELLDLLACIRAELSCTRPVEVRESALLDAPATIGWRRPIVLLPMDWQSWTPDERRMVLAHEVVHIQRQDYPAWFVAQLSLALHFYNPVVHWLVNRLRLEQELAADLSGALVAGGREPYVTALAQMALRLDDRSASWAARPFLPTRGTFIRRIEMLRDAKLLRQVPLPSAGRALLLGALVAVGILIAGLRGPLGGAVADDKPAVQAKAAGAPLDLSYVPSDAAYVLAVRPADLARQEGLAKLIKTLSSFTQIEKEMGVSFQDVEQVTVAASQLPPTHPGQPPFDHVIARGKEAGIWKKALEKIKPESEEAAVNGHTYYKPKHQGPGGSAALAVAVLDDRTLVVAPEARIREILDADGKAGPAPAWASGWQQVATGQAAVMVNMEKVRGLLDPMAKQGPEAAMLAGVAPIWQRSQRVFLSASVSDGFSIRGLALCSTGDDARQVLQTTQALVTLGNNLLTAIAKNQNPPDEGIRVLLGIAGDLLKQVRLERQDTQVSLRTGVKMEGAQAMAKLLTPAVLQARQSAQRMRSQNNMKQIGIALHNYYATYNRLPPAAVVGPDGKTVHSWRVAILPYLEQDNLYRQYKLDEPWDSENNRKIIAMMPNTYRALDNDKGTNPSYFVFTGKETIFADNKGTLFQDITDGTSNTIMAVEAKLDVPWTKPADLPYGANKPLPKLGGYFDNGFNALMADGSVRFIPTTVSEKILRAIITKAGGELVDGL